MHRVSIVHGRGSQFWRENGQRKFPSLTQCMCGFANAYAPQPRLDRICTLILLDTLPQQPVTMHHTRNALSVRMPSSLSLSLSPHTLSYSIPQNARSISLLHAFRVSYLLSSFLASSSFPGNDLSPSLARSAALSAPTSLTPFFTGATFSFFSSHCGAAEASCSSAMSSAASSLPAFFSARFKLRERERCVCNIPQKKPNDNIK